ncbi:hypothetical protein CFP65_3669 [Kitasatospora sp. MMS16-BH015]|uniref:hypothetical protein n=1 Tax=Kitasatospora sp. MMS16-BH015 TaxID=2018025 RepID=UPI000CA2E3DE|nr:hypothetical protein [Kitasatospora sp. MMS16-BH015]AUG78457.1 hypothetical protein CFP65_3669 [Kitasatospora sp. MMS16-BH015]
MGWTAWDIPGWHDDPRLREFYKNAFHPELIDDIGVYRAEARAEDDHAARLRVSLDYLLERRPASVKEWWSLTRYSFRSEDELYAYLQELHDHFYGGRAEAPIAP